MITSRSVLLRMTNVSHKSSTENQTHFTFNKVFHKNVPFMRKRGKYARAGQATDDNTVHAYCIRMLDI